MEGKGGREIQGGGWSYGDRDMGQCKKMMDLFGALDAIET